jgi:hypothetical protein
MRVEYYEQAAPRAVSQMRPRLRLSFAWVARLGHRLDRWFLNGGGPRGYHREGFPEVELHQVMSGRKDRFDGRGRSCFIGRSGWEHPSPWRAGTGNRYLIGLCGRAYRYTLRLGSTNFVSSRPRKDGEMYLCTTSQTDSVCSCHELDRRAGGEPA